MAEYGISGATVSNRVRSYREECQNNDEEKSQLEMMEERRRLRREKAELEKEKRDRSVALRSGVTKRVDHYTAWACCPMS